MPFLPERARKSRSSTSNSSRLHLVFLRVHSLERGAGSHETGIGRQSLSEGLLGGGALALLAQNQAEIIVRKSVTEADGLLQSLLRGGQIATTQVKAAQRIVRLGGAWIDFGCRALVLLRFAPFGRTTPTACKIVGATSM